MTKVPPFYDGSTLNWQTYDAFTASHAGTPSEGDAAFYLACARAAGGPVLELACGTGRIAWPIADAGIEIVGLDRSTSMLALAEGKRSAHSAEAGARIRFVAGDLQAFDLGRTFAAILVPASAFQFLLTPEAQRTSLAAIRRHLVPGGRLVLDVFDPQLDLCLPGFDPAPRERKVVGNPATGHRVRIVVLDRVNDTVAQVLTQRWRFTELDAKGSTVREESEVLHLRWAYRQEMRWLLEVSGFAVESECSDFRGSPPAYGKRQVWTARRG